MTVASEVSKIEHAGDGVTTVFAIPFGFLANSDIQVATRDSSGDSVVISTGFSVAGAGAGSGTCTFTTAPASGTYVVLERVPQLLQPVDIVENDAFLADTQEKAHDRSVYHAQYLYQLIRRCIQLPAGDAWIGSSAVLPSVSARASKIQAYSATGVPELLTLAQIGATVTALTSSLIATTLDSLVRTAAEISAGITPTNYAYEVGRPERYGALGDGVTDDTAALASCYAASNVIILGSGKRYLTSGLTITRRGVSIVSENGSTENGTILIDGTAGSFGLKFIHADGNATHFATGFMGSQFDIRCVATANKVYGIWCDNAEIHSLNSVVVDLSDNTHAGSLRNGTNALYGYFQQDGVFTKCTFSGGSGTHGDGVYLTGSLADNEAPNNNLFLGCRAQMCGGYGFRNELGNGNVWFGGKIQANGGGGWIDADDGLGNGPTQTMLGGMVGFEHNGLTGAAGYDLVLEISARGTFNDISFQSTSSENAGAIQVDYSDSGDFRRLFCYDGLEVNFDAGVGNVWDSRTNRGFGTTTFASGTIALPIGAAVTHSTTQSVSNAGFQTLVFDTEAHDSGGLHSTSSNTSRLTAPSYGLYQVSYAVGFASNSTGFRSVLVRRNGSSAVSGPRVDACATSLTTLSGSCVLELNAGDYVEIQAYQDSGGSLNVLGGTDTRFSMTRVPE